MGEEVHYFPRALANYQTLKATEIYFHSFGGKEVKKKKKSRFLVESCSLVLASGGHQLSLTCSCITPVSASIITWPSSSVCVCHCMAFSLPCVSISSLSIRTQSCWLRAHSTPGACILIYIIITSAKKYFQIRSHPQVPMVKTSTLKEHWSFGGHNSTQNKLKTLRYSKRPFCWVGKKVYLGFSIRCFRKTRTNFFCQPNRMADILERGHPRERAFSREGSHTIYRTV